MGINTTELNALHELAKKSNATLVAVSKTKPIEMILEAYQLGQRDFGENYVQELIEKQPLLPADIRWHFIGHLQSNKVKFIAPYIALIHGVDSFNLLEEINKQGLKNNRVINCLLQIYIAEEESKFGLDKKEANSILDSEAFSNLKYVQVKGFMGMATNTANPVQLKKEFNFLAGFYKEIKKNRPSFNTLSMGMSSDYTIALQAGSNLIRIGSAIFGER